MYSYNFMQWLILFYLYSFIGWVWESCYVSLKNITGACMERMFHVRYWDYSDKKWNLNGHICLAASLVWGCFSVLLTWGIQPLIDPEIMKIPRIVAEFVTILLSVIFTCDFMQSFREAVDLKETLIKLSESSEHIRRMQKRLEVVSAFAEQDREIYQTKLWEKLAGRKELLQNLDEYRRIQRQKLREIEEKLVRRNPGMISEKYGDILKDIRKIMRRNGQKK